MFINSRWWPSPLLGDNDMVIEGGLYEQIGGAAAYLESTLPAEKLGHHTVSFEQSGYSLSGGISAWANLSYLDGATADPSMHRLGINGRVGEAKDTDQLMELYGSDGNFSLKMEVHGDDYASSLYKIERKGDSLTLRVFGEKTGTMSRVKDWFYSNAPKVGIKAEDQRAFSIMKDVMAKSFEEAGIDFDMADISDGTYTLDSNVTADQIGILYEATVRELKGRRTEMDSVLMSSVDNENAPQTSVLLSYFDQPGQFSKEELHLTRQNEDGSSLSRQEVNDMVAEFTERKALIGDKWSMKVH